MAFGQARRKKVGIMSDNVLAEEIAWLRGFGWDSRRIARRLGVAEGTVAKHLNGPLTPESAEAYLQAKDFARERRIVEHNARSAKLEERRVLHRVTRNVA
jgi:hypothetical protein